MFWKKKFTIAALPADIEAELRKEYPNDHKEVTQSMEDFICTHDHLAHPRVVRCIIYLARSQRRSVTDVLRSVSGDSRDAMFWAEYEGTRSDETPR